MRTGLHLRSTRLRRLCSALYSERFTLCLPWVTGWWNSKCSISTEAVEVYTYNSLIRKLQYFQYKKMLISFLNFDAGWSHSYFISIFESHCNKNYPLCLKAAVPFLEALEEFFSWCIMFLPIFLIYFRYKSEIFQFEQSRKVWLIFISWREAYTFFFSGNDIFLSTNLCKIFS